MTTYVFDKIEVRASKAGMCPACGRPATRSQVFWATDNPFNVNEDGTRRTPSEIRERLHDQAAEWKAGPVLHAKCEGASR